MDVGDEETEQEGDQPRREHVHRPPAEILCRYCVDIALILCVWISLLRVGAHAVSVEDEVLAEAGEVVDPRPAEADAERQEDRGEDGGGQQRGLVTRAHHQRSAVVLHRQDGGRCRGYRK